MNDRDLLELAAKASGHAIDPIDALHDPDDWACWNPLTDDGDALRLAVAMRIEVLPSVYGKGRTDTRNHHGEYFTEQHTSDPYAATRRAIVRAAAAIDQAMTEELLK